jgi:hypothetical protein
MCTFSFIVSNALCFTYGFRFILNVNRDYFLKQHLIFVMVKCCVLFAVHSNLKYCLDEFLL